MMKRVAVLIVACLPLAACGDKGGACYVAGETCYSGTYWEDESSCDRAGGQFVDTCPTDATCLGRCQEEDDVHYLYYPYSSDATAAEHWCVSDLGYVWLGPCGGPPPRFDWFTSSCAEMGGQTMPAGACRVSCTAVVDCPVAGMSCGNEDHPYCVLPGCTSGSDCGPSGWTCLGRSCAFACTTPTPGAQSTECLDGFFCNDSLGCELLPSPTCGEPCPAGCCSMTGLTCCQPPFCDGSCAGSDCC